MFTLAKEIRNTYMKRGLVNRSLLLILLLVSVFGMVFASATSSINLPFIVASTEGGEGGDGSEDSVGSEGGGDDSEPEPEPETPPPEPEPEQPIAPEPKPINCPEGEIVNPDNNQECIPGAASLTEPPIECDPQDTNCDGEVIIPDPTPCLLDPSDPSCPEPDPTTGECPPGYNLNEDGNCFPEHDRCPTGYHSHEDDETGRCIPDETPCDEGYIMSPDFPTCERKESVCQKHPDINECKPPEEPKCPPGWEYREKQDDCHKEITIIINKIIKETNEGKHKDGFPDVDIIGLSVKESGDSMICAMDIDSSNIECQEFGMDPQKVNQAFWRVIETDSSKNYDNGNTGSSEIDDAIDAIKSQDFSELEDADNHNFGIDLAWIAINPQGEGVTCLTTDQSGKGKSLCEPFKVSAQDVSGQITEGVEFS
jgi:hypothetical protein